MREKRIFISDVHMGAGKFNEQKKVYDYDWLKKPEADKLASFINHVNNSEDVAELILLGDIMDDWVCPIDMVPPTYEEIIDAPKNKNLVESLKKISNNKNVKVLYLPGNHDMGVTRKFVESNFSGMVYGGSALFDSKYTDGRLHAEHGSAYAMINAPDTRNPFRNRLPLGYFISRVVATKAANTGSQDRHYWSYLDDALESLGPQRLAESIFEAVLEEANLSDESVIQMRPAGNQEKLEIKASDVKEKYGALYQQWEKDKGPAGAFHALLAEINLGKTADRLAKRGNAKVIVFGHSHRGGLDKDSLFVEDRIYANCGTWCEGEPTYVECWKEKDKRYVRLMSWNGQQSVEVDAASV